MLLSSDPAQAQAPGRTTPPPAAPTFQTPPPSILALADAPPTPSISVAPNRQLLLLQERSAYLTLAELAQPELRLAGVRANPASNGQSRSYPVRGLRLIDVATGTALPV